MHIWRLITHHEVPEDALHVYLRQGFVALGWDAIGNLRELRPSGCQDISIAIRSVVETDGSTTQATAEDVCGRFFMTCSLATW